MNLDLQAIYRYSTGQEGRARCPTYSMVLGFTQSIYKRVLSQSTGSIVVNRDSLLPFNPTYVLLLLLALQFGADDTRPGDEILQLQTAEPARKLEETTVRRNTQSFGGTVL